MRDVRNDLGTVVHQRVQVLTLLYFYRLGLAGQHYRTHFEGLRFQVRHLNIGFERSHAAGLIFAHDKLQMILAAQQAHPGVILHILFLYIGRCAHREFHGVANSIQWVAFVVEHHSNHVQRCLVAVAAAHEWDLRARYHQRNGNEKLVAIQPEVSDPEVERQIRGRQLRCEFLLELPFLVVLGGVLVVSRRIVASAVIDFHAGNITLHDDAPVTPVTCGVRAVIAEQIVSGRVLLYSLENLAEVVGVQKSASAGIAG